MILINYSFHGVVVISFDVPFQKLLPLVKRIVVVVGSVVPFLMEAVSSLVLLVHLWLLMKEVLLVRILVVVVVVYDPPVLLDDDDDDDIDSIHDVVVEISLLWLINFYDDWLLVLTRPPSSDVDILAGSDDS